MYPGCIHNVSRMYSCCVVYYEVSIQKVLWIFMLEEEVMSKPIEKSVTATRDVVANVYALLEKLSQQRSIEPLKQLFWSELNYERVNEPLSRYGWREKTARLLVENPLLLATGGDGNHGDSGFPIIYCHMNTPRLRANDERLVVTQLLDKYLDGLFIFSNQSLTVWRFINVK